VPCKLDSLNCWQLTYKRAVTSNHCYVYDFNVRYYLHLRQMYLHTSSIYNYNSIFSSGTTTMIVFMSCNMRTGNIIKWFSLIIIPQLAYDWVLKSAIYPIISPPHTWHSSLQLECLKQKAGVNCREDDEPGHATLVLDRRELAVDGEARGCAGRGSWILHIRVKALPCEPSIYKTELLHQVYCIYIYIFTPHLIYISFTPH